MPGVLSLDRRLTPWPPWYKYQCGELRNPVSPEPQISQHEGGVLEQETLIQSVQQPVQQPHQDKVEEESVLPHQTPLPVTEETEKKRKQSAAASEDQAGLSVRGRGEEPLHR